MTILPRAVPPRIAATLDRRWINLTLIAWIMIAAWYVGVQASGMALNALVTWIGTAHLGLAAWVPLLPAVALATIVTFLLNKYLVFV